MIALPVLALLVLAQAPEEDAEEVSSEGDSILFAPKFGFFKGPSPLPGAPFYGLEVGYLTPLLDRRLAIVVEGSFHQAKASGTLDDPQLTRGGQEYRLTERQTAILLAAVYRFQGAWGPITPYLGVGSGLYLHEAIAQGFGANTIEKQGSVGFQGLGGLELRAGPGGLFLESHYHFTRVGFVTTGKVNVGGFLAASLGYRLRL